LGSSRRERDQRYHSAGGYNPPASSSGGATYQNVQASSSRPAAIGYQEPSYDLAGTAAKLSINDYGSSNNFRLSYSPPQAQPQWTAAPPGRGRGQYQARGKVPAAREPSRSRYVSSTNGDAEKLDRNYRVRNTDWKKFFTCGRVFKTLWTDPAGPENVSEHSQFMSKAKFRVAHGEYVYSKIRRFVVVKRYNLSCQCLPVTTYDGKGYRKRNIKLDEHGLIYIGTQPPGPIPGIVMEPLRIKDAVEELDISYINYGRSYCVDTHVKVKEVGVLDGPSRRLLRRYYQSIHALSDEEESPPPPSTSRQTRETEFLGMGSGLPLPQQSSSSSDYLASGSQFGEDIPVASSRPLSGPVESRYQEVEYRSDYATSSRPVQERTYSASSSRPPLVQYRRGSEIDLDEDLPPVRRRRESNAGSERRKR
jgi:hypothetical protein